MKSKIRSVLSVSAEPGDHAVLRELLGSGSFVLISAGSCGEAAEAVEREHPVAVLCAHALPDGSWRDLLWLLSDRGDPPPVIVISRLADEHLWAEVLNLGGFDVLAVPLDPAEVLGILDAAHTRGRSRSAGA